MLREGWIFQRSYWDILIVACHQFKPSAIRELPVKYTEIFVFEIAPNRVLVRCDQSATENECGSSQ